VAQGRHQRPGAEGQGELLVDDDQDCIWLRVETAGGASCHVGYRSCFYRRIPAVGQGEAGTARCRWTFTMTEKVFDPELVYPGQPNPTKL
jgi:phosphoribosyl-AMP cyclohydrolase